MDFIFSPITADRLVVESTLGFTKAFLGLPQTDEGNPEQEMWLFWNQVDGREKQVCMMRIKVSSKNSTCP